MEVCCDEEIQQFQARLDDSIGMKHLKLLLLRDWNGTLTEVIPIRVLFAPSFVTGYFRGEIPAPFEHIMMRGIDDNAGRSNAIIHLELLLRRLPKTAKKSGTVDQARYEYYSTQKKKRQKFKFSSETFIQFFLLLSKIFLKRRKQTFQNQL